MTAFRIDAGKPHLAARRELEPLDDAGDFLQAAFVAGSGEFGDPTSMRIWWNDIEIPVVYAEEIAFSIDTLLSFIRFGAGRDQGESRMSWVDQGFMANWSLAACEDDEVAIRADWMHVNFGLRERLHESGDVRISRSEFAAAWRPVLAWLRLAVRRHARAAPAVLVAELEAAWQACVDR